MTQEQTLRPLGDADLAALRARFEPVLAAWAQGWLASAQRPELSLQACSAGAFGVEIPAAADGTLLAATATTLAWLPHDGVLGVGRRCVLEGDKLLADTRLNDVLAALGRNALCDFVARLLDLPAAPDLTPVALDVLASDQWGFDGVKLRLALAATDVVLYLPRGVLARWLLPLRSASRRLGMVRLPASLGRAPVRLSVCSQAFEMPVTEFLKLTPGNVITLDQPLDSAFEVRVPGHPDIKLKSYPGRRGQALAMEIFEN